MSSKNLETEREHSFILQQHFTSLVSGDHKQLWEERNRQLDRQLRLIWRESLKTGNQSMTEGDGVSDREKSIILSRMWKEAIDQGREDTWLDFINQQNADGQSTCGSFFVCNQSRCSSVIIKPCTWLDHFGVQTDDEESNWLSNTIEQQGRLNSAPALTIAHLEHVRKRQMENRDITKTSTQPHPFHTKLQEEVKYTGAKEYGTVNTSPVGPSSKSSTPSQKCIIKDDNYAVPPLDSASSESKHLKLITQELSEISLLAQEEQLKNSNDNVQKWLQHQTDIPCMYNSNFGDENVDQNSGRICSQVQENSLPLGNRNEEQKDVAKLPKACVCCTVM